MSAEERLSLMIRLTKGTFPNLCVSEPAVLERSIFQKEPLVKVLFEYAARLPDEGNGNSEPLQPNVDGVGPDNHLGRYGCRADATVLTPILLTKILINATAKPARLFLLRVLTNMTQKVPAVRLNNGEDMPMIGIGTWRAYDDDVKVALNAALECGYRHIDTAYLYQNEAVIGEVLKEWFASGRVKREDIFITTKLPMIGNREKDVSKFLQKSLDMMGLNYVDLYLVHNPVGFIGKNDDDVFPKDEHGNTVLDFETNLEGIWKGMEAQVDAGKAKAIGISNFNSVQIEQIVKAARIKPANQQIEVHAYHMQHDLRAVCEKHSIPVCAYGPIGAPYKISGTKELPRLLEHPLVMKIAQMHGKTPAQILLRHLLQHGLIVIPKSANAERVKQNFQVFDFNMSPEEMAQLDSLDQGGAGRIFTFSDFKGIKNHPEYCFQIPF